MLLIYVLLLAVGVKFCNAKWLAFVPLPVNRKTPSKFVETPCGLNQFCVVCHSVDNSAKQETQQPNKDAIIVAVDLQPMSPLDGVIQIVGDITKKET